MCFKETKNIFRINLDTYIHNKGKNKVHQSKYKTMKNIIPGFSLQENTPNSDGGSDGLQCRRTFVTDF